MRAATAASPRDDLTPQRGARAVRLWLLGIALMVYAMILVGGATRLTDSGLSITEWRPVTGVLPPFSEAEWRAEFEKYRQGTAEYRLQNAGMSLDEFKPIYWWEWGHRLLGRVIGVAFLLPLLAFWALGWTTARLRARLFLLFALGGLQGFVGWWMVASGVGDTDRVDVAPYRLMVHLSLALAIIAMCCWVWLDLGARRPTPAPPAARAWSGWLLALLFVQLALGALVAGLDAGRGYTDWPLMSGRVVPGALLALDPIWRNLFENEATTQFLHRGLAYLLVVLGLAAAWRFRGETGLGFRLVAALMLAQTALGVVTLVHAAPVGLGLAHQGLAVALLLAVTTLVWRVNAAAAAAPAANAAEALTDVDKAVGRL
jgi:cytochrome c oxidase assembly protein subunit 15